MLTFLQFSSLASALPRHHAGTTRWSDSVAAVETPFEVTYAAEKRNLNWTGTETAAAVSSFPTLAENSSSSDNPGKWILSKEVSGSAKFADPTAWTTAKVSYSPWTSLIIGDAPLERELPAIVTVDVTFTDTVSCTTRTREVFMEQSGAFRSAEAYTVTATSTRSEPMVAFAPMASIAHVTTSKYQMTYVLPANSSVVPATSPLSIITTSSTPSVDSPQPTKNTPGMSSISQQLTSEQPEMPPVTMRYNSTSFDASPTTTLPSSPHHLPNSQTDSLSSPSPIKLPLNSTIGSSSAVVAPSSSTMQFSSAAGSSMSLLSFSYMSAMDPATISRSTYPPTISPTSSRSIASAGPTTQSVEQSASPTTLATGPVGSSRSPSSGTPILLTTSNKSTGGLFISSTKLISTAPVRSSSSIHEVTATITKTIVLTARPTSKTFTSYQITSAAATASALNPNSAVFSTTSTTTTFHYTSTKTKSDTLTISKTALVTTLTTSQVQSVTTAALGTSGVSQPAKHHRANSNL